MMKNEIQLMQVSFILTADSFDVSLDVNLLGKDFNSLIACLKDLLAKHNDDFCIAFAKDLERLESEERGECTC